MGVLTINAQNTTEMEKVSYSIGVSVAKNVKAQGLESIDSPSIAKAFKDVFEGNELEISEEEANLIIQDYFSKLNDKAQEANKEVGMKFLEENAKKEGVVTTASGLQYIVMTKGDGAKPKETDNVTVHYHGTLLDGKVFDSSVERNQPATFPLNGVIKGWTEGVQLMNVGSKFRFFIPSDLAYGERGAGGAIGPNATLIFEVELISIGE
jgi:FKBP-type peptidyl-prolyl cis-trans isomerase FklB